MSGTRAQHAPSICEMIQPSKYPVIPIIPKNHHCVHRSVNITDQCVWSTDATFNQEQQHKQTLQNPSLPTPGDMECECFTDSTRRWRRHAAQCVSSLGSPGAALRVLESPHGGRRPGLRAAPLFALQFLIRAHFTHKSKANSSS